MKFSSSGVRPRGYRVWMRGLSRRADHWIVVIVEMSAGLTRATVNGIVIKNSRWSDSYWGRARIPVVCLCSAQTWATNDEAAGSPCCCAAIVQLCAAWALSRARRCSRFLDEVSTLFLLKLEVYFWFWFWFCFYFWFYFSTYRHGRSSFASCKLTVPHCDDRQAPRAHGETASLGEMLVRHRHLQARPKPKPKPKPRRKDADETKPRTSSSLHHSSIQDRQQLKRLKKKSQGVLESRQTATFQNVRRQKPLPTRARGGSLPGSPTSDLLAIPAVRLDERDDMSASSINTHNALHDLISSKLDEVISSIDGETFPGKEEDLCIFIQGFRPI